MIIGDISLIGYKLFINLIVYLYIGCRLFPKITKSLQKMYMFFEMIIVVAKNSNNKFHLIVFPTIKSLQKIDYHVLQQLMLLRKTNIYQR